MRCISRLAVVAAVVLSSPAAGAEQGAGGLTLPPPPDVGPLFALVAAPDGDCNAGEFFESAERELWRRGAMVSPRAPSLAPDDFVLTLVLRGMRCRACALSYSRRMAIPPTRQKIPASKLYAAAAGRFLEDGRRELRAGRIAEAEAEFGKAVVLGRLLYGDPGITVIQDWIAFGVLARGAEGLGDAALARGDAARAEVCVRFLAAQQAYVEAVTRFVRALPWAALASGRPAAPAAPAAAPSSDSPAAAEAIRAVAALDSPSLRTSVRLEILMMACIAGPLVGEAERGPLPGILERASRDPDERLRAVAAWGMRLSRAGAQKLAAELSGSPWP